MQSSTGRSHFKTAAWRPKRDRQLRQRAPSEELGGPIILLLLLRHIGEWSCAARTIDESGYERAILHELRLAIPRLRLVSLFARSWQATKSARSQRHRCSAASSALSNERIFDIRSARCLPMPPMTPNR